MICQGIAESGAEAHAFSIDEADAEFVQNCDGILLGTPTYHGTYCAKIKLFLDEQFGTLQPAGKTGGAFATANYIHGGADTAILGILDHMLCYGMKVYSGGNSFGKPFIHYGPAAISGNTEDFDELFREFGRRFAKA